jgi:Na+-driven multidrug efflux pump
MLFAIIAIMSLGLVDSYFISFLGTEQLAAIGFIMPITFIVTSVALGLGMAISSLT